MFQNIEVKTLFEDQIHERHQFTLNIEGHIYQGIFHDEKIQWFHPHPKSILEGTDLEVVESKISDFMTSRLDH
ncbi:hypothetical protein [Bacillus sp. FSL K6-3431]|uniref:hypothetical protein n=1 Tax=Bacillus sp. FSL K6-3431 TaxID=2921500 RepID=UPI0030F82AAE